MPFKSQSIASQLRKLFLYLVFSFSLSANTAQANPELVADISNEIVPESSIPSKLVEMNGVYYFTATTHRYGKELWATDGVDSWMVADIYSGSSGSDLGGLTVLGDNLFFTADDGLSGIELWKSDGTEAGTKLVADIWEGAGSSYAYFLTVLGDQLYFHANNGTSITLWRTDGVNTMIQPVPGVPNAVFQYANSLTVIDNEMYFFADGGSGTALWKIDEVTDVAEKLTNQTPKARNLVYFEGAFYFTVENASYGRELWKSNGTVAGTGLLADINVGAGSSSPTNLIVAGQTLFFVADDGVSGRELWKTDGTVVGTVRLADIAPGVEDSLFSFSEILAIDSTLYFEAKDNIHGNALWKSDGTLSGTMLVKNIGPGSLGSFTQYDNELYLSAGDNINGQELWRSDGTEAGTELVSDIRPGSYGSFPRSLSVIGDTLYFSADDGVSGFELWKTNGIQTGTTLVANIQIDFSHSFPRKFVELNGLTYFIAETFFQNKELWVTDGITTSRVASNLSNRETSTEESLVVMGGMLYFTAYSSVDGIELWKSDGTLSGTVPVADIFPGRGSSEPAYLTVVGNTLYFVARDALSGTELWKSDGTESGTVLVADIRSGTNSSYPKFLTEYDGKLFFSAYDGVKGRELWSSDGTASGTRRVSDINPGSGGSDPQSFAVVNNFLYFSARDRNSGRELWKSDGTANGTVRVADILFGGSGSSPENVTGFMGEVYFSAQNGVNGKGRELWKSDGTASGTIRVADIFPGKDDSNPEYLTVFENALYFTATDPINGREIWKSDGTFTGTQLAFDLVTGSDSSDPQQIVAIGDALFFSANNGVTGQEPWRYSLNSTPPVANGEMGNYVWEDLNGDGIQDANEQGLANVSIDLLTCSGSLLNSTITDGDGGFLFTQLAAGDYQMRYHLPTGYRFSPSNQGGDYRQDSNANLLTGLTPCLSMTSDQQRLAIDAGITLDTTVGVGTGVIGDYIWNDLNGNGIQESYEAGLADVVVDLKSCTGSVLSTTTSDGAGQYSFSLLAAGAYQVYYHLPAGYRYSPTGQGGDYRTDSNVNNTTGLSPCLTMVDGQQRLAIDAGMVPDSTGGTGSLGDYVWDDLNRDGIQDSSESGLANIVIDLMSCTGTVLESTTTDSAGYFLFTQLAVGDYQMYFHLPTGYSYSPAGQGGNYRTDSNVNNTTGMSPCLPIHGHQRTAVDAGMMQ